MLKNFKIKILTLLTAIVAAGSVSMFAAVQPGVWKLHGSYAPPYQRVVVTPKEKVYFLAGGSLFCHDVAADETIAFSTENYLNEDNVTDIFYNSEFDYLLVAYSSGNIDLIYDNTSDGDYRVVNLSDIKDANIDQSKHINGVAFDGVHIYVATDFGLVDFSVATHSVVSAGIYGKKVFGVAVLGKYLYIYIPYDMLAIDKTKKLNSLDNFFVASGWGDIHEMRRVGDDRIAIRRNSEPGNPYYMSVHIYSDYDGTCYDNAIYSDIAESSAFIDFADGSVGFTANNALYKFSDAGKPEIVAAVPEMIGGDIVGAGSDVTKVWSINDDGLQATDLSTGGITTQRFKPEALSVKEVGYIIPSDASASRLYVTTTGCSNYKPFAHGEGYDVCQQTSVIGPDGRFSDVALRSYVSDNSLVRTNQLDLGVDRVLAPTRLAEDPDDESTYYLATANDGVLKISDGKLVGRYDCSNSPMVEKSVGTRVFDVAFDKDGNLWVAYHGDENNSPVLMLPAAKTKVDPATLKASDWKRVATPGFTGDKDMRVYICKKSNTIFVFDSRFSHGLVVIDTKGTWSDLADDAVSVVTQFVDQDGKTFSLGTERFVSIAEDKRGRVWLGSSLGVIEITNPASVNGATTTINRLKVPRNDGTNSADYLLGSDRVFDIAVDNSNRKWLATEISGVYLVNENGSKILEHYMADNSPLLSNMVNTVFADPASNSIYFGTSEGLFEYGGSSSAPMDDYSEIYAYPNPVRPDYDGPITIVGLMDDSLVKIGDAAGNVLAQMKSEGGMAVWDGRDRSGNRVRSGVYYVFASSGNGNDSNSKGGTAKIVVVN